MTPEDQLKIYEADTNAEQNIRNIITSAYKDLKPEAELVNTYYNEQFPAFYGAFNTGYGAGTGATDLTPTTLLQNALGEAGRKATTANVASSVFDTRKARMEDLIKAGLNQWGAGYTAAQNAYDRWWEKKKFDESVRQFNASRSGSNTQINLPTSTANKYAGLAYPNSASQKYLHDLYTAGYTVDPQTGKSIVGASTNSGAVYQTVATPTKTTAVSTPSNGYGTSLISRPTVNTNFSVKSKLLGYQ